MTPRTKAGQALSRHGPAGLSWNELDDAIDAIEREAAQQERKRIRASAAVAALEPIPTDWGVGPLTHPAAVAPPTSSAEVGGSLDVEALAAALQALCDGPRRIQIVENDIEGMGSLVWPNEYADLLAAAYADAIRKRGGA